MKYEHRVVAVVVAAGAVPALVALPLLWGGDHDTKTEWTLTLFMLFGVAALAGIAHARVVRPMQTVANLAAALREQDYAVRGRHERGDDAYALALAELAALAVELRETSHRDAEAAAGLSRIVEGLDVVVIAADRAGIITLANRAAERAVGAPLFGRSIESVGIAELFTGEAPRTARLSLAGGGVWEMRRSEVRLQGLPHALVVLTDVRRALRAEEREAWQRLVRVLGHEINNSLGPIRSIAETLRVTLAATPRAADLDEDLERGLGVIHRRTEALARFMTSYARLARLPAPKVGAVDVGAWVRRAAELETRTPVVVEGGPAVSVAADSDQIDQLLINLIANAVEAAAETGGGVRVRWSAAGGAATIVVEDDGPGVADATSLFVPFFTTKASGSGIGLALSRQIAEAQGGTVTLRDRRADGARGAQAVITLPLLAVRAHG
ncbi:MAG TPA: ATP-binding protein [Kofleriaceae bacterium]|nr:ATP-binding protein [Kofleriaceae bacterium]